ncbi:endolytic transglycosylase MltG [Pseudomonas sp. GCM10022188]|uniref:endolytic transglycosylase MltG n=1 Tax=Pseudomonas TaxID=286 RepID=UPI0029E81E23|nr:endolytic transglycosylase MltG [Pseudomonas oryzagri]MCC6077257.1 endolytic transglycosylase MltG [Pseudomonas oryzagri]
MKRTLLYLLEGALMLFGLMVVVVGWQQNVALDRPLTITEERLLEVPSGATPSGLLVRLADEGVIDGALWLRLYWRFNYDGKGLQSGEYRLTPGQTARELLRQWRSGEVVQYSLTLVEGWTFRQLRTALAAQERLEQTLAGLDDAAVMQRLGLAGQHPEGRFFPDTYRYTRGMRDIDLLRQAQQRLAEVLDGEWQQRAADLPYRDAYEALIMASLVEKETGVAVEREQIAGVFVRRLSRGMLLQTDPTVIYGLGERYDGNLTRAHLREPTPYNTYVNAGLPPTPIAMVGREAIHAALHPAEGDTLYFVARGDGSHVFTRNLDEHNRAVREFQLKRREDYRSSPGAAPQGNAQ